MNSKIQKFNDVMSKMQTDMESHMWMIEMQEKIIEEAEKKK